MEIVRTSPRSARLVGYSSMATIGLRPPPDDVGRQKGCKVRIARDPGTTVSGQASGPLLQ
jgi:hypothetical protein